MAAGLRVVRGPGWALDDDDGGEGHVGTLVEVGDSGTVNITWDGGQVSLCRATQDLGHDLRVLDNATVGVKHPGILCDECGESSIAGMRWKCSECSNFDLCSRCYFSDKHDANHQFFRIETPKANHVMQERRSKSTKLRVLGLFPDATVVRGMDWEWNDQDGGKGSTGRITDLLNSSAKSARSMVEVEWENGTKKSYRVGFKGKVDLQFTEEAPGPDCYTQHLPVLDTQLYLTNMADGNEVPEDVKEGDNVMISLSAEELQKVQKTRSGWSHGMTECIGKVGRVLGFVPIGDAIVCFDKRKYRLFPGALKKVASTTVGVGSRVRIIDDEQRLQMLQEGHGGYNDRMRPCLGKVGEVIRVDDDGDVVVRFGERQWIFAPDCCIPAPGASIDHIASQDGAESAFGYDLGDKHDRKHLIEMLTALSQVGSVIFFKAIVDEEEDDAIDMVLKKPDLATVELYSMTGLHLAAIQGQLRLCAALVEAGANTNRKDKDGDTPLLDALGRSNKEVAEYLIRKGCDVHLSNNNGQTAGHRAAMGGFTQVLRALVDAGANFNALDDNGDTPLHDAITKGQVSAAEVILSWPHLDLHRTNKKGYPLLHYACQRNEPQIVHHIIRQDNSIVNEKMRDGCTPLHVCSHSNNEKAMKVLLRKAYVEMDTFNNEQKSPLHVAAYEAAFDCLKLLIQAGAGVNSQDGAGNTALHATLVGLAGGHDQRSLLLVLTGQSSRDMEEKRLQMALFLLQHGADPEVRNFYGQSAIDTCPSSHGKIKEALLEFINKNGSKGSIKIPTSLEESCPNGDDSDLEKSICSDCQMQEADILFMPCVHQVLCKDCCPGVSKCPECNNTIKHMFMKMAVK